MRPGEKLYEDLTWPDEKLLETQVPKVRLITPPHCVVLPERFPDLVAELRTACEERDADAVKRLVLQ
jgi:FlaA1/EpsC-like NDP-sugar epimerase